ncbi:lytic murein transglycosylase [Profundibacterium mesophilum]|uniref:Lytic murein transglycosylase n=1 Tax=Profundibacterium mesophilum KAUST100406-0324 TaxID=1037889 RepID=A0A921NS73_9RHOB|nr:lytic murein transglycosylase [Profundibacterium mesophilum]KAF0675514.1 Lytic murein transglycosylase [Profundibacterium mesophilum KAUST100406-0324]
MRPTVPTIAKAAIGAAVASLAGLSPASAQDAPCGGDFRSFVAELEREAVSRGHAPEVAARFFSGVQRDQRTIDADRRQGVFQIPFIDFARRLISAGRIEQGRQMATRHDAIFDRIERDYGVSRGVLLAFWAFETDYGAVQGDFNTVNSLVTLAHDCRRPELFRPQVFAAIELAQRGGLDPARTQGAWAGEIGMVQMLPEDILRNGTDGDGDGRVELKTSVPDALVSGARMLSQMGWRPNEPWITEVAVPGDLDLSLSGLETVMSGAEWAARGIRARSGEIREDLPASLVLPQGAGGPAFLAYPNFNVYFEWNQSFVYVMTAAYFATRLEGAPIFDAGSPAPGLGKDDMLRLQRELAGRGHDVGEIDGILGAGTRGAVRAEQERLGLPADGWPTAALLNRL